MIVEPYACLAILLYLDSKGQFTLMMLDSPLMEKIMYHVVPDGSVGHRLNWVIYLQPPILFAPLLLYYQWWGLHISYFDYD